MKRLLQFIILFFLLTNVAMGGNVTVTLSGTNTLNIWVKGDTQPEEAGNISIFLYFRDDGVTDLTTGNVDGSQLTTTWGWGTGNETKQINTGTYNKGGHTFTRRLGYDNAGTASLDDYWSTGGIKAIVCNFTAVGSGNVYIELTDPQGLSDYSSTAHSVTFSNQDYPLPVQMSNMVAEVSQEEGIVLRWFTESEVNTSGFHVWRMEGIGEYLQVTTHLIESEGNSSSGNMYEFSDRNVRAGVEYWYKIQELSLSGGSEFFGPIRAMGVNVIPQRFNLEANYPNPFNPETKFWYDVPEESEVTIKIYSLLGREVKTLYDGYKQAGRYELKWDGQDALGDRVSSGIYILRMQAGTFSKVRKMTLVR